MTIRLELTIETGETLQQVLQRLDNVGLLQPPIYLKEHKKLTHQ